MAGVAHHTDGGTPMNWNDLAVNYAKTLPGTRGVIKTVHPGISVVFVPSEEADHVRRELAARGFECLAVATHTGDGGAYTFAAVVESNDSTELGGIVKAAGSP